MAVKTRTEEQPLIEQGFLCYTTGENRNGKGNRNPDEMH